jgi:hypothetical protein
LDSYLDVLESNLYADEHQAWRFAERAIELALKLRDSQRIQKAKTILFTLFRKLWADGDKFMWWKLHDIVLSNKGLNLSEEEKTEIVSHLEIALSFCSDKNNKERFDPHLATSAATRLAAWYARQKNHTEEKRVILSAGKVYEDISTEAAGLTAVAWLEDVLRKYKDSGLSADASRVEGMIRQRTKDAQGELQHISSTIEIDREEYNQMLNNLVDGGLHMCLKRIAITFLVKQAEVDDSLQTEIEVAPFTSHLDLIISHPHGFTAAVVGSIRDDYTGRAVHQASKLLGFNSAFLSHGLQYARERYGYSSDEIVAFLYESSLFTQEQKPMIDAGVAAWFNGNGLVAVHLLVPQVEAALREIAVLMGVPILRPDNKSGGFIVESMGNILRDQTFSDGFDKNFRHHLIALYTDPRGQNLRNGLAHGLISHERLGMGLANWVVHSLILLSMLRVKTQSK